MPQTYAHQRFGDLVYDQLPEEIRAVIDDNRTFYDIGLQGPDILFYYHPLWENPVATLGAEMHHWSGRTYFARAVMALTGMDPLGTSEPGSEMGEGDSLSQGTAAQTTRIYTSLSAEEAHGDDADAALVYLYGCLCHYALDSSCHPYINQYDTMVEGITHSVIEGDLDRALIEREGRDPVMEDQTARFQPSRAAAHVIARFYPEVPEGTLYAALRSFVAFHHLLRCPFDGKRNLLYGGLRLIGQYDNLRGHIMAKTADPLCKESTARLEEMLVGAVPCAAGLIAGFSQNLRYDHQFQLDYEGVRHEE